MCVCVCVCVRVSQWAKRLSSSSLAVRFGLGADVPDLLRKQRLRWLGHMARTDPSRLPKQMLFAELPSTRLQHRPKKRWGGIAMEDIRQLDLAATGDWYGMAQDRREWRRIVQTSQQQRSSFVEKVFFVLVWSPVPKVRRSQASRVILPGLLAIIPIW